MQYDPATWRAAYHADGFVIVPDLIDPATLNALRAAMDKITSAPETVAPALADKLFYERQHVQNNKHLTDITPADCGNAVRQIADLSLFAPVFADLICYAPLLDVLEALFASSEFSFNLLVGRPKAARVGNGIVNMHRDTPDEGYTTANTIIALLCLDDMTAANGPTVLVRGSHNVPDEEARQPRWRAVAESEIDPQDKVAAICPAGAGLFFSTKTIHGAGHNRSPQARRVILTGWAGPDALPTLPTRVPYEGLRPRSRQPAYQTQLRLTFPHLCHVN